MEKVGFFPCKFITLTEDQHNTVYSCDIKFDDSERIIFRKSNMVKMHTFKIIPKSVLWAGQWFNHIGT